MQTELKRTAIAASVWRRSNPGSVKSMPAEMQRSIVKLLEHYSWEDVCQGVGISRSSLGLFRRAHAEQLQLQPRVVQRGRAAARERRVNARRAPAAKPNSDFIEMPVVGTAPRLCVELKLPSGIVVQAHSAVDVGAVGSFVAKVLADASALS
jgi:hypothetical protein